MVTYRELGNNSKVFEVSMYESKKFMGIIYYDFDTFFWRTPKLKERQYRTREEATPAMLSMFESTDTLDKIIKLI